MSSENNGKLKRGMGNAAHIIAKVGLSTVPIVGSAASELFSAIIAPPISKRREKWIEMIAQGLKELEKQIQGFKLENLSENEAFVTMLLNATQSALLTHQREKLEALRNVVLNSAIPSQHEEAIHSIFLHFVDSLTPWHLKILSIFGDPPEFEEFEKLSHELKRLFYAYPHFHLSSVPNDITGAFDEFNGREDLINRMIQDLASRDLLDLAAMDTSHHMATQAGIPSARITDFGKQFLDFIRSPLGTDIKERKNVKEKSEEPKSKC